MAMWGMHTLSMLFKSLTMEYCAVAIFEQK